MHRRATILPVLVLAATGGCSSLVRERLAAGPSPADIGAASGDEDAIHDVSVTEIEPATLRPRAPIPSPPDGSWIERQRFIFARAWQEMRRDMDYESIDSFQELAPEVNREVRMMREDLAGAGGTVTTTRRRPRDR